MVGTLHLEFTCKKVGFQEKSDSIDFASLMCYFHPFNNTNLIFQKKNSKKQTLKLCKHTKLLEKYQSSFN